MNSQSDLRAGDVSPQRPRMSGLGKRNVGGTPGGRRDETGRAAEATGARKGPKNSTPHATVARPAAEQVRPGRICWRAWGCHRDVCHRRRRHRQPKSPHARESALRHKFFGRANLIIPFKHPPPPSHPPRPPRA